MSVDFYPLHSGGCRLRAYFTAVGVDYWLVLVAVDSSRLAEVRIGVDPAVLPCSDATEH